MSDAALTWNQQPGSRRLAVERLLINAVINRMSDLDVSEFDPR